MTMLCEIVMAMVMVGEVLGQATMETEDMEIVSTGTVEGFMKTKEFKVSYVRGRGKDNIYCCRQ